MPAHEARTGPQCWLHTQLSVRGLVVKNAAPAHVADGPVQLQMPHADGAPVQALAAKKRICRAIPRLLPATDDVIENVGQ